MNLLHGTVRAGTVRGGREKVGAVHACGCCGTAVACPAAWPDCVDCVAWGQRVSGPILRRRLAEAFEFKQAIFGEA